MIEHPEVYVPAWRPGSIYLTDSEKAGYDGEPVIGHFNATLLTRPKVSDEISQLASDVKLIAVVRNPVDRAYSWYNLRMRQGDDLYSRQPSFEEALGLDPDLVANGLYSEHLEEHRQLVGAERMWIGVFDDLVANPLGFIGEVLRFVGAEQIEDLPTHWGEAVNYSAVVKSRRTHKLARRSKATVKKLLGSRNQWLADRIEQSRLVRAFKVANESGVPRLDEEQRSALFEFFVDDVAALEEMLGRDLSAWRSYDPKSDEARTRRT